MNIVRRLWVKHCDKLMGVAEQCWTENGSPVSVLFSCRYGRPHTQCICHSRLSPSHILHGAHTPNPTSKQQFITICLSVSPLRMQSSIPSGFQHEYSIILSHILSEQIIPNHSNHTNWWSIHVIIADYVCDMETVGSACLCYMAYNTGNILDILMTSNRVALQGNVSPRMIDTNDLFPMRGSKGHSITVYINSITFTSDWVQIGLY